MSANEDFLKKFRPHFDPKPYIGHPCLPPISTMQEVEDKLVDALGVLEAVEGDDEAGKQTGLAVATMAIDFGSKVLGYLGVIDGSPTPKPLNIQMAQAGLSNLINEIKERVDQHYYEMKMQAEDEEKTDLSNFVEEQPDSASKPSFAEESFSVEWQGDLIKLGNTKMYHLFKRLCQNPGNYVHIDTLRQDVWGDSDVSDEGVQKQISSLRLTLEEANFKNIEFDGREPKHYRLILG
jgi:hypothetical protein